VAATIASDKDFENVDITYSVMVPILQAFAKLTHSYGWSIILLTLLVRALVWPLVTASTKSMQRMSQLQPMTKKIQEKYKDNPELYQKKTMEFYAKNKMNPLGGCLPTLVQLPILIALFSTFTGPPFQDKEIPVKVMLAKPADAQSVKIVNTPTSGANSPYVSPDGTLAKFAVQPGDQTLVWGRDAAGKETNESTVIDFHAIAVEGDAPANFKPAWKIITDPNRALIDPVSGQATFPAAGEVIVSANFPNAKPIEIPIKVEPRPAGEDPGPLGGFLGGGKDPYQTKTERAPEQTTVDVNGKTVNVTVSPGPSTVVAGRSGVQFEVKALDGGSLEGIKPRWAIVKDANSSSIDVNGRAVFPRPGEITIGAVIPGEAKDESFGPITSIGKLAKGVELFEPRNFDVLFLLIAFAGTMYLSSMLMAPAASASTDPDQAAIQKQTQQTMPIAVTAMFFFFALPAGVFLYLVVSNIVQTLQTWLIYKSPPTPFVDVTADDDGGGDDGGGKIIDITGAGDNGDSGTKISVPQKKAKKKK